MRAACWAYGGMADWSLIVCVGDVGDWCNAGRAAGSRTHTEQGLCSHNNRSAQTGSATPALRELCAHSLSSKELFFPSLSHFLSSVCLHVPVYLSIKESCLHGNWLADKLKKVETLVYCDGCDVSYKCVCVRVSAQDMNITPPSVACQNWSQCIHGEECADWMMTGANWLAERQHWPKGIASQFPSGLKTDFTLNGHTSTPWGALMCVFLQIPV